MRVPSGDQAGDPSSESGLFVRFVCPLPSLFMTRMSKPAPGSTSLSNAIFVPSGDQSGA
jgi:hypothetical protein